MAYSAGDFLVNVQGTLPGNEIWSNTWAFKNGLTISDQDDVVTALHTFYGEISDNMSTLWTYEIAQVRDLSLDTTRNAPFAAGTGVGAGDALPTQCAVRISLSNGLGVRGGPFLCGWRTTLVGVDGQLDLSAQGEIETEVGDLNTLVIAVGDCVIGIHRPGLELVVQASEARIGRRFDVIRKRANNTLEQYVPVTLG